MKFPSRTLAAFSVIGAVALAGCSSATTAEPDKTSVTVALLGEPASLNPIYETVPVSLNIFRNVFDQLTEISAEGDIEPRLAESWESSEDATEWTFHLRQDATWQDGTPVTAEDVVFTVETGKSDPKSNLASYLTDVATVEAVDEHTVVFTLAQPFAPFDRQLTLIPIVPKAHYEKVGGDEFAKAPMGSGAYAIESISETAITLRANEDYWGGDATFEEVVFEPVPDDVTRANALQSGELDIAQLAPVNVSSVEGSGSIDVLKVDSNLVVYLGYNSTLPALSDPVLRQAIDMAIDREAIGTDLLYGLVTPNSQLVSSVTYGFDPDAEVREADMAEAKRLVEQSDYDGSTIKLFYPTSGITQVDQIAQVLAENIAKIGVDVTLAPSEPGAFTKDWFDANIQGMYIRSFAPSVMDAELPYRLLLKSGGMGYANDPEIDQLLVDQASQSDADERLDTLQQIGDIIAEKTYYSPLFTANYAYGRAAGVDWEPRADGLIVLFK